MTFMRYAAAVLLVVLMTFAVPRLAFALDDTGRSATWMLQRAALVQQNGAHNVLLRALRQMRDPELQPLFEHLVEHEHPGLQIHGILGLGEIDPDRRIDLDLLASLDEPAAQAQLVSSAVENDLLSMEACRQLMASDVLDPAVKIIVATRLVSEGVEVDGAVLAEALEGENEAMAGMAALLQMEQGDPAAVAHLDELNGSDGAGRDNVRAMLLQTAIRFEFQAVGPWALEVAREPRTNSSLRLLALRTAMRFNAPQARQAWTQRFQSSTSAAERIRMAVLAMDLADQLEPTFFEPMLEDDQSLVQKMGQVGRQMAAGESAREAMLDLLEQNNLLTSKWVLEHAKELPIDEGLPLLVGVVLAAEDDPNPRRFRGQRLENTVLAAEDIADRAERAPTLVPQLIESSPAMTQEAILMGLIRSERDEPHALIGDIHAWPSDTAESLALLLKTKHGVEPDERGMQDLALIVRGGAGLQEPLRIQAAWLYLKLTGQKEEALVSVLDR